MKSGSMASNRPNSNSVPKYRSRHQKAWLALGGFIGKLPPVGPRDSGYDPRHPKVRQVVNWLDEMGVESGVHPGYNTFRAPEKLRREVAILRETLGDRPLGEKTTALFEMVPGYLDRLENCGLASRQQRRVCRTRSMIQGRHVRCPTSRGSFPLKTSQG